ncbi:flagellar basal body-associated FliL family protein [Euzebya sp.]|uniref:flagellar basal body-associated FliL family protein n=1 Tax=Euzebya sp. TaxID=1971409 RepID=UPI0035194116
MAKRKKDADAQAAAGQADGKKAKGGEEGGHKKRSMLIPAVVVALAVLGGGAMAGGLIGGGGDGAEAAETEGAEATPTPTPTPLGTLLELESVTINLNGGHFLKLGVAVELSAEASATQPPTAPIYDAMIELFGPMTMEALTDPGTREGTKQTLLAALSDTYGEDIVAVYFTEFVMQ